MPLRFVQRNRRALTKTPYLREPAVGCIGDDFQQLLKTSAPDGGRRPQTRQDRRGLSL
jgi:hypothetical protein